MNEVHLVDYRNFSVHDLSTFPLCMLAIARFGLYFVFVFSIYFPVPSLSLRIKSISKPERLLRYGSGSSYRHEGTL